jgi:Family of unknown function (DUF6049)
VLAVACVVLGTAGAAHAVAPSANAVTVRILDLTPTTPAYSPTAKPLTIRLSLNNTTDSTLQQLSLNVERDVPVTDASQLDGLLHKPAPVNPDSTTDLHRLTIDGTLSPHATRTVTYVSSTSSQSDQSVSDICLCYDGIYPVNITVLAAENADDYPTAVGFGQTYLPSFQDTPAAAQVSWLWPLVDRPHRLTSDTDFLDDDLAASVRPGGRLFRALQVVTAVSRQKARMTLVIDPDVIDELVVMTRGYTVPGVAGKRVPGTGRAAATAWLAQLKAALPNEDVTLTPYADPDVEALAQAGTPWLATAFTPAQRQRVESVVGGAAADVAWPPTGTVSEPGLAAILRTGASTVVTSDASFTAGANADPRLDAVAAVPNQLAAAGARAIVTDASLQRLVGLVLTRDASGAGRLPELVSSVAVRVAQNHADGAASGPYLALAPDRYLDVDPTLAARAVLETSKTTWSRPMPVRQASQSIAALDRGQLANHPIGIRLPAAQQAAAARATAFEAGFVPALTSAGADTLFRGLPAGIQRMQSAGWAKAPAAATQAASDLNAMVQRWDNSVYIAQPGNSTYTLASSSSPLFVTVVNTLDVDVRVKVALTTANGVIGFHADDIGTQTIPAGQRAPLRVPVHVQRPGRFTLAATLATPAGQRLGRPVILGIRSTALGTIGIVITAAAGGVLVLALAIRVIRRHRHRGMPA